MIPIGSAVLESAIDKHRERINEITDESRRELAGLRGDQTKGFDQPELAYLDEVIKFFSEENFICQNQEKLREKINLLPDCPTRPYQIKGRTYQKPYLADEINEALGYGRLREEFYPTFFQSLGIRACVYCNSLSTLSVRKFSPDKRKITADAKYQLDHHHAKKLYPFLSICFYNLYPVCGVCNNVKSKSSVEFDLYSDELGKNYQFELSPGSVAKYLVTKDTQSIGIRFYDPDNKRKLLPGYKTFQEVFNIAGIYETQTDLAEELIIKSQMYPDVYTNILQKSFSGLLKNKEQLDRVLFGNYMDIIDVHKRPMAKFTQDIARQLKLIK